MAPLRRFERLTFRFIPPWFSPPDIAVCSLDFLFTLDEISVGATRQVSARSARHAASLRIAIGIGSEPIR